MIKSRSVLRYKAGQLHPDTDELTVEEPLEIRLRYGSEPNRKEDSVAISMRTPGHDHELALGFLLTEGILQSPDQVRKFTLIGFEQNILRVELQPEVAFDINHLSRHVYTSSSCGICGKASIEQVVTACPYTLEGHSLQLQPEVLSSLPEKIRVAQQTFERTGGIHAAALFDQKGNLLFVREDVGRHNALDKLIGRAAIERRLPLSDTILLVSGRASFELVQKALMAGIPVLAAIGAPSSLAVDLAEERGMQLIGFLKKDRWNVYVPAGGGGCRCLGSIGAL